MCSRCHPSAKMAVRIEVHSFDPGTEANHHARFHVVVHRLGSPGGSDKALKSGKNREHAPEGERRLNAAMDRGRAASSAHPGSPLIGLRCAARSRLDKGNAAGEAEAEGRSRQGTHSIEHYVRRRRIGDHPRGQKCRNRCRRLRTRSARTNSCAARCPAASQSASMSSPRRAARLHKDALTPKLAASDIERPSRPLDR